MAQERKHFLINPHTSSVDSMPTNLQLGEIAVRHANENPELIIKKNDGTFATFVDKSVISALDTNLSGQIEAVAGDVAELSGATKAGLEARYTKDEADAAFDVKGAAASALTEAKTHADNKVASAVSEVNASIEAVAGDVAELGGKIDTIIGVDSGMTTRQIVVDELAKQLIAEGAQESLNELKEIADWIQQHPKDAAEMNSNITSLSAATGTLLTNIETVAGDVAELSGATVTLANSAVTSIEIKGTEDAQSKQTVTATIVNNKAKFDFTNMVIDCGTF